jgi:parallel beta-helix repeat protein
MALLEVLGAPFAPGGKSIADASLTVVYSKSYTEGIGGERYPPVWKLEYDSTNGKWKPEGRVDGTTAYLPGGQAQEIVPPSARFTEVQKYTDGEEQTFCWSLVIIGSNDTWEYPTAPTNVRFVSAVPGTGITVAWANAKVDYAALANGIADDRDACHNACSAIATPGGTLYLQPGTYRLSTALSVPATIIPRFDPGAKFSVDTGITATILGDIEAGRQQIFDGLGTVTFAGNSKLAHVYPEWWGAVADGTTDCTDAINAALTAAGTNGSAVLLGAGLYLITAALVVPEGVVVKGQGMFVTQIKQADSTNAEILIDARNDYTVLEDFSLDGNMATNGAMDWGIVFLGTGCQARNLEVVGIRGQFTQSAGLIDWSGNDNFNGVVEGCWLHDNGATAETKTDGIYFKGYGFRCCDNTIEDITDVGVVFEAGSTVGASPNFGCVVSDNVINLNGAQDEDGVITGNGQGIGISCINAGGAARFLEGVTVTGNVISGTVATNGAAIYLLSDDADNTFRGVNCSNNVIRDTVFAHGIVARFLTDSSITGNQLFDTTIPTDPPQDASITQNGSTTVTAFDRHGIVLEDCQRIQCDDNLIRSTGAYGLCVSGTIDSLFCNNYISQAGRNQNVGAAGIIALSHSGTQSTGNIFVGNFCIDNYRYGILIADASDVTLISNTCRDNTVNYTEGGSAITRLVGNIFGTDATKIDDPTFTGDVYLDDRLVFTQGIAGSPELKVETNRLKVRGGSDGTAIINNAGTSNLFHVNDTTGLVSMLPAGIIFGFTGTPPKILEVGNELRLVTGTSGLQISNPLQTVTLFRVTTTGTVEILDGAALRPSGSTGFKVGDTGDKVGHFGAAPVVRQNVTGSWGGNAAGKNLATALATLGIITDSTTL